MNKKYILAFFVLLVIEIIIGLYVKDNIVRPYIGDVLVVILMYTFIRGFVKVKFLPLYLFLLATLIEIVQYVHIVDLLGLQDNKLMSTIIGTSFDIKDILCYLTAAIILIIWERTEKKRAA